MKKLFFSCQKMETTNSAEITYEGALKRKGAYFGIWSPCYCILKGNEFVVMKTKNSSQVERRIIIKPDTRIMEIEGDHNARLQVLNDGEPPLFLMAETIDILNNWILALRGATYNCNSWSMDCLEILSVLGRGYYGKVMLVKKKGTNELYAIKTVHKARLVEAQKVHTIIAERNILIKARHPFIVNLCFAFQTSTKFYLGLEYVPGGELFRHAKEVGKLSISETRLYIAQVALALEHLHGIGVIYRDLKPENILLAADGTIKLTDFGLSKDISLSLQEATQTFCGTSEYLAPEVIKRNPYSFPIDWWSLGILTYELLYGETPFYNRNRMKMFNAIASSEPKFPSDADDFSIDFIKKLLNKDPTKRATFVSLKNHPFWGGLNFDDVLARRIRPQFIPKIENRQEPTNFDLEFTTETPTDSVATPLFAGSPADFAGFSYTSGSVTTGNVANPPEFEEGEK